MLPIASRVSVSEPHQVWAVRLSSGTLNPTIPYHTIPVWGCGISRHSVQSWAMLYEDLHVIWWHPDGLFQPSGGSANRIFLTSTLLSIYALCPQRERCLQGPLVHWPRNSFCRWSYTSHWTENCVMLKSVFVVVLSMMLMGCQNWCFQFSVIFLSSA